MSLQLKGNSETDNPSVQPSAAEENPWDYKGNETKQEPYRVTANTVSPAVQVDKGQDNSIMSVLVKIVIALVIGAILIFGGKGIVSVLMPEGEDITSLINKDCNTIASELNVTFQDNTEWVSQIHQYSNGTTTVKAAEGIGVVYIDGKQAGIHIRDKNYTIYGIQIGQGEKEAHDHTTYPFDNFMSILDDMSEGKTTTYYYYNNERNDCVALTINDTTNRIVGITYFNDFNLIMENISRF